MESIKLADEHSLRGRIEGKAYELYEKRGRNHGNDLNDWLTAERLVLTELSSQADIETEPPKSRAARSKSLSKKARNISVLHKPAMNRFSD